MYIFAEKMPKIISLSVAVVILKKMTGNPPGKESLQDKRLRLKPKCQSMVFLMTIFAPVKLNESVN